MWGQNAGMRLPTEVKRFYEGDLWSTYLWADGTALANSTFEIFTTQKGQQGQGFAVALTISETNIREGGRIAAGLAFTTRQVAIEPSYNDNRPMVRAEIQNLQNFMVPIWSFLNTEVEVAPTSVVGQAGGIFGTSADTGAVEGGAGGSRIALNNGAGQAWVYHELPVLLPANTTFSVLLRFGSGALVVDGGLGNSALRVRGHLIGVATSAIPQG